MRIFGSNNKGGWECEPTVDGSQHCVRFEKDKEGNKHSTGTEITIGTDQDCKPVIGGDVSSIMDEDEPKLSNLANKLHLSCKRERGMA